MNQISSTRQLHYDLLRIFASFMVVMLHVSAFYWDKIQPQTEQWMALNLFDSAVRSCVPLFFMLSGAFLLAKELPLNKLLGKCPAFGSCLVGLVGAVCSRCHRAACLFSRGCRSDFYSGGQWKISSVVFTQND